MANWISKDLEDVGFFKRFFIIELPHLVILGVLAFSFIIPRIINEDELNETLGVVLGLTIIIALLVSLILVFATIPYKNKVKRIKGFKWEWKKPWTWFVSYTARIVYSAYFYALFYSVYVNVIIFKFAWKILKTIFSGFLFSAAASSRVGSSYSSSSGSSSGDSGNSGTPKIQKFYCKYCGAPYLSISSMTMASCTRHPDGYMKGRHAPYEGSEKSKYTCKYCGAKYSSISDMTMASCSSHPDGCNKGKHAPAL